MRKINRRKVVYFLTIFLLFLSLSLFQSINRKIITVSAQDEKAEVIEVQDRFIILNWTIPSIQNFDSFRISLISNQSEEESTWSMVLINSSIEVSPASFSLVNFTSDGIIISAQKIFTLNFTSYVIEHTAETVQAKITGLQPSTNYSVNLYLTNSSLVMEEDGQVIYSLTEELYWNSTIFQTEISSEDTLEYSRRATILSSIHCCYIRCYFLLFCKEGCSF